MRIALEVLPHLPRQAAAETQLVRSHPWKLVTRARERGLESQPEPPRGEPLDLRAGRHVIGAATPRAKEREVRFDLDLAGVVAIQVGDGLGEDGLRHRHVRALRVVIVTACIGGEHPERER